MVAIRDARFPAARIFNGTFDDHDDLKAYNDDGYLKGVGSLPDDEKQHRGMLQTNRFFIITHIS